MKIAIAIVLIVSISASAQRRIADSVLYGLTLKTIESFTKKRVKILNSVTIPPIFWDAKTNTPKTTKYFKESDLEAITSQIQNPSMTSWEVQAFTAMKNIHLVRKLKGKECLVISLPISSQDLQTVVIYYEAWDRAFSGQERSGAGFATIWKRRMPDGWIKHKEEILWLTVTKPPAHYIACTDHRLCMSLAVK